MKRAGDDDNNDEASASSDSLLREVARVDDRGLHAPAGRFPASRIGRFIVRGELGRGGMGVVYRAHDEALGRSVALKVLPAIGGARAEEARARLLREARAAAALEHPNVVSIYEVGEDQGSPFIAMELVTGQNLRERMRDSATLDEKLGWLTDIAEALAAAHESGIVHRDVKPENVMIRRDGRVKVLDFGIARQVSAPVDPSAPTTPDERALGTITEQGARVGTPRYMAPEQLKGEKLDGRCDQFAWAVLAYELFSGRHPWEATDAVSLIASVLGTDASPLDQLVPDVPQPIAAVVARALSKSPAERFASMREVAVSIREPRGPLAIAPQRRRPWRLGALAAIGVSLLAAAWLATTRLRTSPDPPPATTGEPVRAALRPVVVTDLPLPESTVAEALTAYRAGLHAYRDGDVISAARDFDGARKLDAAMGAAFLRAWLTSSFNNEPPSVLAELFRQASERRAGMPRHEAELLDALAPCARGRGAKVNWCVDSTRALAESHPEDAEFQHSLAGQYNLAGRLRESLEAERRALKLDPKFIGAWAGLLNDEMYLGENDALLRDTEARMGSSPSVGCLWNRGRLESDRGQPAALERTAREELAIAPNNVNGLEDLANAEACAGASLATLRHTLDQRAANTGESHRDEVRTENDLALAWMQGDFETLFRLQAVERAALASATDVARHAASAYHRTRALLEVGRRADALAAGREYLELRPTLIGFGDDADWAITSEWFGMNLRNMREAGMSRGEALQRRDAFVASWKPRLGPDYQPFLWTIAYLETVENADEAREALEMLPRFGGLLKRWDIIPAEAFLGHLYLLLDRVDDAIPWLERGAHACREPFSIRPIEASFWLGEAREKKGDTAAACEAYAHVLKRWGNAKPNSVTGDEAKKRSKALGCGR